jgi:HK97 gp10 family phage protein
MITVIDNSKEVYKLIQSNEANFLQNVAKFIEAKMDYYVPVKSGYLKSRNQVTVNLSKKEVKADNDAPYSGFVEKGTKNMREQPFITPSIYNHINEIERIAKGDLGNGF